MERKPLIVLGTLVLGGFAFYRQLTDGPPDLPSGERSAPAGEVSTGQLQRGIGADEVVHVPVAAGHEKDCPLCAAGKSHAGGQRVTLVIPPTVFEAMVAVGNQVGFALPDGKKAMGVVERFEVDKNGNWRMTEGRLTEPAEGRFILRRQPEGTPSGRYAGALRFPAESYGYLFGESAKGEPQLTFHHAGEVSCVRFAAQAPAPKLLLPDEHPTDVPIPGYQNGVIPLESLPNAVGVVYLDFDGEEGPHDGWGDFDAAPSGSNNDQVREVWARVAEDFAPYNVNVTTDLQVYLDAPGTSRQRCIITPTNNAAPGAGGVAYIGSWNWGGDTPCWAFYAAGKASAEVISHEIGHTLGLGHDGQNPNVGYYGGHGNGGTGWAPIMGVGYYQNLSQWSKGEYANANELQDDLAVIDSFNAIDFRADDHGNTTAAASPLELFGTTVNDDGAIANRTDVDVFTFKTTGGTLTLAIEPVGQGPNLDVSAEIRNASNVVVASSNPDLAINANFNNLNLAAGTYTILVDGVGRGSPTGDGYTDYGSIGHYEIDGIINGALSPDRFATDEFPPVGTLVGAVTPDNNHGANPLTYSILSGNTGGAFSIGAANGTLTVANPAQFNHDLLSTGWNDPAEFELLVQVTNATQPALNETLRVIVTVNDTEATAPVILKHRYSFTSGATDAVGDADLTLVGGAAVSGGQLDLPGSATPRTKHAKAQGAALAELAATINGSVSLTIEGWFNQDAAQNWAKVFMAGAPSGADYLDITPRRQVDGNVASMSLRNNNDTESHAVGGGPLPNNANYYVAAIWDGPANRMTLHIGPVGGALQTFTTSMNGRSLADIEISEFYLGSPVFWGDPDFDGQIDELRLWNGALSAPKVATDFAAGPNPPGDSDLDGLPDAWELTYVATLALLDGNLSAGSGPGAGSGDFDGDGLSDYDEYHGGIGSTNPTDSDTDNDDFPDGLERLLGTDPNNATNKPAPVLAHRYAFNSGASDAVGHADLSLVGTATVAGGELELPGGTPRTNHAMASGAALAELAATINGSYALTMEAWFNQDTAQNWAKLMMAGQPAGFNYIDITPRRGIDGNVSSHAINNGATEGRAISSTPLSNNIACYCAAIWNPLADQLTLKIGPVGGALQTFTGSMGGHTLAGINVNEFRVGAAVQFADPDFDGQVSEFRIWRGALSNAQVAASFAAGPGQPAGDLDDDDLPDEWELSFAAVTHLDDLAPAGDFDNDGLSDAEEYAADTDPTDTDSDNDGFTDGFEDAHGSDPDDINSKPVIPPTALAHRWSFASGASDSVGNADLTLIGAAVVSGGALDLPGGLPRTNHASAQGAALAELERTIQSSIAISMEGWFRQDTTQNWSKLFMAGKGSGGEYLDITPRRGAGANLASISFNNGTVESAAIGGVSGAPLAINTTYFCAAVWDPLADQLTLRIGPVGGTLSTYTASLQGRSLTSVELNEFYLGAAVQFPDPDFDGKIEEFRVWSGALSETDVKKHFALGTEVVDKVPVVGSTSLNATKTTLTLGVSGLIPGITYHLEASTTLQSFVPLAGSQFTAGSASAAIPIPVNPTTTPKRFFRLAEGPVPPP